MAMIKIFDANDRDFSSAGNIIIEPLKCLEFKKKSLNGWYIEVEIPIKYKDYISKDKLCVVQTKSKLNPQAFRIGENIEYSTRKIKFTAEHVMFDARDYILVDVRPTNLNGINGLNYINQRTDKTSPFTIYSNVQTMSTAYFVRKNLLEAWTVFEERWGGIFDADNWNISFLTSVGHDNGESVIYGKNMQGFDIFEDWSSVCTRLYPVGYDGIMLPEKYLDSDIQYEKPYSRVVNFETNIDEEEQTEEGLIAELRENASAYLEENKLPKISYTIISNINDDLEIGDIIEVKHPLVNIKTEVLEYEYNLISKKVKSLTFGNYNRDVKTKFDNIKNSIFQISQTISKQEVVINAQTNLINTLNKNGYVYIDDNEILILDTLPKENARNVWRFGLGGIGFSSNGYEGPFETAMTMDGQINANFITTGTLAVSRIEGLAGKINYYDTQITGINIELGKIESSISDVADITTSQETNTGRLIFENINQSEPIRIVIHPLLDNISYLYPRDDLFPADNLYLTGRTLRFTNTTTSEVFDYELPDDLLYYDAEHYDEFILDYDRLTCCVNKKCTYNSSGEVVLLAEEITKSFEFPHINLSDGNYTVEILKYETTPYQAYLFARLMAQNYYTSQFSTRAETNSKISQVSTNILANVNAKLTNYSTTTEMNTTVSLKANELMGQVSETYATKTTTNNLSTRIKSTAKSIELAATDNSTSCGLTIRLRNEDGTEIDSKSANITLSGLVKFTDLKKSGSTEINGANITTGKISAARLELTDYLTISSASNTYATKSGLSGGTTTINGACITTGTLSASKISGGSLNLTGNNTTITSTNFSVDKNGNIAAKGGTIGGFTIGSHSITAKNGNNTVFLDDASNGNQDFLVVRTGTSGNYQYPFYVRADGTLHSTKAVISGTITATSGTFDNCTIKNTCTVPAGTISGTLATSNIPNLSASKITSGTMSGDRINGGTINVSKLSAIAVWGDSIQSPHYNTRDPNTLQDLTGQNASIIVQHEGQYWRKLVFTGGILTAVLSEW